ncbi:ubiquitin carboxyl-terminal hydrolase 14-like [Tubulanus polymorphus]|uniref:ubiquitin carboxyl-terminal hydrolase 14-like n=1 Tax=Tubulanus polymorphus TaxID=672921 RepID=UPI003DA2E060
MSVFKVNVKWGKQKFEAIECDMTEPPLVFKAQLYALSGVEPARQKVMMKGSVIKDDEWGKVKLKDGVTLLMMGSADALPQEPAQKITFWEDMNEQQMAAAHHLPPGLTNLGNTCYMNATLQCLRSVPELQDALKQYNGRLDSSVAGESITAAMKSLFLMMDKESTSIPPIIFLQILHNAYPIFGEKSERGVFMQQDANECWTEIVRCLQQKLPLQAIESSQGDTVGASSAGGFIDKYMGIEFDTTMKCVECDDEPVNKSHETLYQLSCFIVQEVKYMHTGLKSRLQETITKNSSFLGRDAQYVKTSKISRLPGYLPIQFVRFYYKEKEAINAKILKDVKFPLKLDVFDLCTEELQQKLLPMRAKFKERGDAMVEEQKPNKKKPVTDADSTEPMDETKKTKKEPFSFPDDVGSNNSGYYELTAVLTHQGRSSSSGHYVAWVRRKGDDWLMFDDDKVAAIKSEDILKLSGGGDWHCAYVLLYSSMVYEYEED